MVFPRNPTVSSHPSSARRSPGAKRLGRMPPRAVGVILSGKNLPVRALGVIIVKIVRSSIISQHHANEPEEGGVESQESSTTKQSSLGGCTVSFKIVVDVPAAVEAFGDGCPQHEHFSQYGHNSGFTPKHKIITVVRKKNP